MIRIFAVQRYKKENEIGQTVSTHVFMGSVCDIFAINTEEVYYCGVTVQVLG